MLYFSVKNTFKLLGKTYIPCVCYTASEVLIPTIKKLEAEGKVTTYNEKVFFQNGKIIEKVKKEKIKKVKKETKNIIEKEAETNDLPVSLDESEGF